MMETFNANTTEFLKVMEKEPSQEEEKEENEASENEEEVSEGIPQLGEILKSQKFQQSKAIIEKRNQMQAAIEKIVQEYGFSDQNTSIKTAKYVDDLMNLVQQDAMEAPKLKKAPEMVPQLTQTPDSWKIPQHCKEKEQFLIFIRNQKEWIFDQFDVLQKKADELHSKATDIEQSLNMYSDKSEAQQTFYSSIIKQVSNKVAETEQMLQLQIFSQTMIENLINDLLDLAKLEQNQFAFNTEYFNLSQTIYETFEIVYKYSRVLRPKESTWLR